LTVSTETVAAAAPPAVASMRSRRSSSGSMRPASAPSARVRTSVSFFARGLKPYLTMLAVPSGAPWVPRSSIYEYARRRVDPLPSLQIGWHRRFDRRTVESWLGTQLHRPA